MMEQYQKSNFSPLAVGREESRKEISRVGVVGQ